MNIYYHTRMKAIMSYLIIQEAVLYYDRYSTYYVVL